TLTELQLDSNQVGDKGAQYLDAALHKNTTLTTLWLNNNKIGDKGAQYLVCYQSVNNPAERFRSRLSDVMSETYLFDEQKLTKVFRNMNISGEIGYIQQ
ncbi:unnamed protein product, partial [Didymodactylos carnosus]